MDATEFVAGRIVTRYGHPARAAHLYLFRLMPNSDFGLAPPDPQTVIASWMDEGGGLAPVAPNEAVAHCQAARAMLQEHTTIRPETRRLMARLVVFSVEEHETEALVIVQLFSRALAFTPKGDRRATETWRRAEDGTNGWYSAYPVTL
ncbi:MAG: hypothetical protein ACYDBJ_17390 [Aggregatilineales bacterium]